MAKEDVTTLSVQVRDGVFMPANLTVNAKKKLIIDLENIGDLPVEFENLLLHIEKIVPPHTHVIFRLPGLDEGIYIFTDDLSPQSQTLTITAK